MRPAAKTSQKQLSLPLRGLPKGKAAREHGGEDHATAHGRKTARPFDPARPLHITMRSRMAVDEGSMLNPKHVKIIKGIVYAAATRHGVVIQRYVCVGNHLHLLLQTKSRRMHTARPALRAFLRQTAGLIARVMTGAKKGTPAAHTKGTGSRKFWDHLVWSRIVTWGKDLCGIFKYFEKNRADSYDILACWGWHATGDWADGGFGHQEPRPPPPATDGRPPVSRPPGT